MDESFVVGGPVGDSELLLCHGMVCVVGRIRDLILQLSKSSIYSTKPLYGVELLWPLVLVQSSILRNSMGYIQTDKNQLSVMYAFEYLIESALTESERTTSNDIMLTVKYASDSDFNFIEDNIDSRCCYFISLSPEQRKKQLISIVRSFHSLWGKYAREKQDIKMLNEMNNTSWVWPDNINW
ncbi:Uncharacterised protein [Klebsiella pneumoniae]|nr:Uncharacterised protein [Klebsiella pneumoniae]